MSPFVFLFAVLQSINSANGTTNKKYCDIPTCIYYYDGCNDCICDINTGLGLATCTLLECFTNRAEYCISCDNDMLWLATDDNISQCGCPEGTEITDTGCKLPEQCPDESEGLQFCNFPIDNDTECSYNGVPFQYEICSDDIGCDHGFHCDKVEESIFYEICTPLKCKLDINCERYDCLHDCVGIGYGQCVKDEDIHNTESVMMISTTNSIDTEDQKKYCDIPYCLSYFDGCNACFCNIDAGNTACSFKYCSEDMRTAEYCTNCDNDMLWLVTDDNISQCGCPKGTELTDTGCKLPEQCPNESEELQFCNFPMGDDTECSYNGVSHRYQICVDDEGCDDGFECEKIEESIFYETCTPLACKLDINCQEYDCLDDCVGIGWGKCIKSDDDNNGGNTDWDGILNELEKQRRIWNERDFDEYVYSQRASCFCLPCFVAKKYITVQGDKVIMAEFDENDDILCNTDDLTAFSYRTIDDWFQAAKHYAAKYKIKCPNQGTKTGDFCGGSADIPCDDGFICIDNPTDLCGPTQYSTDCGGVCVPSNGDECGGIDAKQCEAGYRCMDNPEYIDCNDDCPGICVPEDSFYTPCKDKSLDIKYDESYGYPIEIIYDIDAMAYDGGSTWYLECIDPYKYGMIIDEDKRMCDYVATFDAVGCPEDAKECSDGSVLVRDPNLNCDFPECLDECDCEDEEDIDDPYCCSGKEYDNLCLAECDGVKKPDKKCDKGQCDRYSVQSVGVFNVLDRYNEQESDEWNYWIFVVQILIFSICCLSIGISLPFCCKGNNKEIKLPTFPV